MTDIEGAILAGGKSRRMGFDKSTVVLGESSVIRRIGAAMAPVTGVDVRVIGRDTPGTDGYAVQPDLVPGLGPLSGVHAALATARASKVLVVACDLPFVTSSLLMGLCEKMTPGVDAVVPRVDGRAVPVCALYRTRCLGRLEAALERRELQAHTFVEALETVYLDDDVLAELDPRGICLENINTPTDLARARAMADEPPSGLS